MLEWIKQIFSNWGLAKDAMTNPSETGGEVAKSIIEKLNPALQRIIVLILIIIAMVLGANIGIEYQAQKMVTIPPTVQGETVNPKLPPAEHIKAIEVWKPSTEALVLPEARSTPRPRAVQADSRKSGIKYQPKLNRPVRSYTARYKRHYWRYTPRQPVMEIASSGIGGY